MAFYEAHQEAYRSNPSTLAALVLKADKAMNEKACSEEDTECEDDDESLSGAGLGSTFDSIEMMDGVGVCARLEETNAAAIAAAASVSSSSLAAHRRVSPSMPQPKGTKNSSQLNRFNDTFERFTESLLVGGATSFGEDVEDNHHPDA
ncbi:hypothetical protein [Parasitella parasitica]|uniref:Uncharacterized protein n=1 Tax=Parasitella parasitica TaxID=35722 RepID=A0A0B7MWJ5_9FUNG|nr:hypothetical protein [Parasitella parasitica]